MCSQRANTSRPTYAINNKSCIHPGFFTLGHKSTTALTYSVRIGMQCYQKDYWVDDSIVEYPSYCPFTLPYCQYNLHKHSFVYDVYLMVHTNFVICFCLIQFHTVKFVIFTVCCFLCYLMAFDCQEIKGLHTYLLTYISLFAVQIWC